MVFYRLENLDYTVNLTLSLNVPQVAADPKWFFAYRTFYELHGKAVYWYVQFIDNIGISNTKVIDL